MGETGMRENRTFLSKSLFLRGLRCPLSLYLDRNRPEVRNEQTGDLIHRFDMGHEVELLARCLFPGGTEISWSEGSLEDQIRLTREVLDSDALAIYEGAFSHGGVFVKCDILARGSNGWGLHEVKMSTQVKEEHDLDLAVQYYVLAGLGIPLERATVVHVNREYVRRGDILVGELFSIADRTDVVREIVTHLPARLERLADVLSGSEPVVPVGHYCHQPNECDFTGYCFKDAPGISVLDLSGRGLDRYDLYNRGFRALDEIPLDLLPERQRFEVESYLYKKRTVLRKPLREFLGRMEFPLSFLDFETFSHPIPPFEGTSPYDPIPFQYSLHVLSEPRGEPIQREFLAEPGVDPRMKLLESLRIDLPEEGSVVVYNAAFEKRILALLAAWFPEQGSWLESVSSRIVDLHAPFRSRTVHDWRMVGSTSLKDVLPAFVPHLGYDDLEIRDGETASQAYLAMAGKGEREREEIRTSLLEYCRRDTLGLVELYRVLAELVNL